MNKTYEKIVLITLAIAAVAVVVNMIMSVPELRTQESAAWVQAIGSIAAIGVAIGIAQRQFADTQRLDSIRRAIEGAEKIRTVRSLFNRVAEVNKLIVDGFESCPEKAVEQLNTSWFLDCKKALESLPLFEIPDEGVVIDLVAVVRQIESFVSIGSQARTLIDRDPRRDMYFDPEENASWLYGGQAEEFDAAIAYNVGQAKNRLLDLISTVDSAIERCDSLLRT